MYACMFICMCIHIYIYTYIYIYIYINIYIYIYTSCPGGLRRTRANTKRDVRALGLARFGRSKVVDVCGIITQLLANNG